MSNERLIARPYAKAAFEFAKSRDLAAWLKAMKLFADVAMQPTMQRILKDPMRTNEELLEMFSIVCEGLVDKEQQNFLQLVAETKRLAYLPEMYELFLAYYDAYQHLVEVDVYTPFVLSADSLQKMQISLEKRLKSRVEITQHPDKSLIGGAVIRIGDQVIDGSVKGRLNRLATHLNLKENLCQ